MSADRRKLDGAEPVEDLYRESFAHDEEDDGYCGDYPEHDWELFDEADGDRIYHCARCGAEIIETEEERNG